MTYVLALDLCTYLLRIKNLLGKFQYQVCILHHRKKILQGIQFFSIYQRNSLFYKTQSPCSQNLFYSMKQLQYIYLKHK